jgi:capsular exopolysaccharide synthesis family protein
MSRIREALRRAAQEKERSGVGFDQAGLQLDDRGSLAPAVVNSERDSPLTPSAEMPALRFEDLVKHCSRWEQRLAKDLDLSVCGDCGKIGAESFRTLRSRLYQISDARVLRKVLITSSLAAEGKTFAAINLALSIVRQPQRKVLLVDADLRAGSSHMILKAPNKRGLSDYLRGESDEFGVIQNNSESNLWYIPSGSSSQNASELLLSGRMKVLLDRVTPLFDWVIVDSPPALAVHDASSLADLCDGVLLVVRAGVTSHESAQMAAAEFRRHNLLGVLLNQVEKDELQANYYGYYGPSLASN